MVATNALNRLTFSPFSAAPAQLPAASSKPKLPIGTLDHVHQFRHFLLPFGCIAAGHCMLHTMTDVVVQDGFFDAPQRSANGRDLGDYIDAITPLFNHPRYSAHLAFDLVQAFEASVSRFLMHRLYYTPAGYSRQRATNPGAIWHLPRMALSKARKLKTTAAMIIAHRSRRLSPRVAPPEIHDLVRCK